VVGSVMFILWIAETSSNGVMIRWNNKIEVWGHKELVWNFCYLDVGRQSCLYDLAS